MTFGFRVLWRDRNYDSRSFSNITNYHSDGSFGGYSVGVYGTWYKNGESHEGLFFDTWLLYNWFNNTVKGQDLLAEEYKSKSIMASIEAGYTLNVASGIFQNGFIYDYKITPQAQFVWSNLKADDHY